MKLKEVLNKVNKIRISLGYKKYLFSDREFKHFVNDLKGKEDYIETGCFRFELKERAGEIILRITPTFRFNVKAKEILKQAEKK